MQRKVNDITETLHCKVCFSAVGGLCFEDTGIYECRNGHVLCRLCMSKCRSTVPPEEPDRFFF